MNAGDGSGSNFMFWGIIRLISFLREDTFNSVFFSSLSITVRMWEEMVEAVLSHVNGLVGKTSTYK